MPAILRFLDIPGLQNHGLFGFREHPTEDDADLLHGEFIALVEDEDTDAASEICQRLEAGEAIVPLPKRDLYQLQFESERPPRRRRRKLRLGADRRIP